MPLKTKSKPDPNAVYVAKESVSFALGQTINTGERRAGTDPLVRDHFEFWVPDGTPIRAHQGDPPAPTKRQPQADVTVYEALTTLDVVVSRRPLRVWKASTKELVQLPVATAVARDSELVRLLPDAFEKPKVKR